jgi:pseudouridine-5'-phosphate glycosidase
MNKNLSAPRSAARSGRINGARLESTIICHGMPWPKNWKPRSPLKNRYGTAGRPRHGAHMEGRLCAGLPGAAEVLARSGQPCKASRRDFPSI